MAWIESHTVLIRHRKVSELAIALRLRRSYVIGHLHALWHAALEQRDDGDLSSWSDEFIAECSDYPGDAPQYVRLLQEKGWLDEKLLHDWIDYAGRFLTLRYKTSNPTRLVEIWRKHGREYGSGHLGSGKEAVRKRKDSPPTKPNRPNQPVCASAKPDTPDPADEEKLDEEIRAYISSLSGMLYSPIAHSNVRKMVESAGWPDTRSAINAAIARGVTEPTSYALKILAGNAAKERLASGNSRPRRAPSKQAVTVNDY